MKFTRPFVLALLFTSSVFAADWTQPWLEPQDTDAAAQQADEYAWRLFVALNWPADPVRGTADPTRQLGEDTAVVWQYWQNTQSIFLPQGADPGPWKGVRNNDPIPAADRFEGLPINPQTPTRHIVEGAMTGLTDPIAAASHLNETRLNRVSFEYIRAQQLYSLEGQSKRVNSNAPIAFPKASRHIKAQWRPISAAQKSQYFSQEIIMQDGTRRLYGLTALHIATKDIPHWFWATFEHTDMLNVPSDAQRQLKSQDKFACGNLAADCGQFPRGIGLENTVWQNYRLRGTMTDFLDAQGNPALLSNSQLESNVQASRSSCITCHARAALSTATNPTRLTVFNDDEHPLSHLSNAGTSPRPGFIGRPQAEWFNPFPAGQQNQRFVQLDFVWSLEKAHSEKEQMQQPSPASSAPKLKN